MFVTTVVLTAILAAAFLAVGLFKLLNVPQAAATSERLGIPPTLSRAIGALEVAAAVGIVLGLFWAPIGIAAYIGLILLLIGAAGTHLRAKDPISQLAPAITLGLLSAITLVLRIATA